MTKIICGLDDSDAARAVAVTANWLARAVAADVIAVHVSNQSIAPARPAPVPEGVRIQAHGTEVRGVRGAAGERLAEIADKEDAVLLVVGSRGRGSLRSAALGSVSRELAVTARCPVVIVPPPASVPADPAPADGSVVCGVDGSDHALAAVTVGARLARALRCRPIVVHALQDFEVALSYPGARPTTPPLSAQDDARRRAVEAIVERAAAAAGGDADIVVEPGPPAKVLERVAERERAVLLVLAARGLRPVRAALLGSTAARATVSSRRAVVLVSERAEDAMRAASGSVATNVPPSHVGG